MARSFALVKTEDQWLRCGYDDVGLDPVTGSTLTPHRLRQIRRPLRQPAPRPLRVPKKRVMAFRVGGEDTARDRAVRRPGGLVGSRQP